MHMQIARVLQCKISCYYFVFAYSLISVIADVIDALPPRNMWNCGMRQTMGSYWFAFPPPAQKGSMLSCLSRRWFYHMDTAVRYFAFLAWYEALMEVSLHRCFADVLYHSPFQGTCRLCVLEVAGFRMETVISPQQTTWLSTKTVCYEAARRNCKSSSFSCWGRKRPSLRLGSQSWGAWVRKDYRCLLIRFGKVRIMSNSYLGWFYGWCEIWTQGCETAWALWFGKEDVFISRATAWKCLENKSAGLLNF